MIQQKISLSENAYLITYVHEYSAREEWTPVGLWQPESRPAIVVLPGGAYCYHSDREGEPIALSFYQAGFHAFVLHYSVGEECTFPRVLEEMSLAFAHIREHADEWRLDKDKIAVSGFSAGGALASMLATQWNTPGLVERLNIAPESNRPNALLIGYALTCMDDPDIVIPKPYVKAGKIDRDRPDELNTYRYVGTHTPPAFIWHTMEDQLVSYKHALKFAQSLGKQDIPFELHIFAEGLHGQASGTDATAYQLPHAVNLEHWLPMAIAWMRKLFAF